MVNKFFYRHGGAESYVLDLTQMLQEAGYDVIPFAMAHPKNLDTPHAPHFVSHVDLVDVLRRGSPVERMRAAARIVYSTEAAERMDALCGEVCPEVAHLHNIYHQLSPSILRVLKRRRIPIVMTLHDYKLICPAYQLLAPDGICERCRGGRYYNAVVHRCSKGSLLASVVEAAEAYVHRFLKTYDLVDLFVCPSRFLLEKMVAHGWPREKFVHVPNFAPLHEFETAGNEFRGDYIVYFGRLSPEKGVATLLRAMVALRHVNLLIVGEGSVGDRLRDQARALGLANVSFLPRMEKPALAKVVSDARFAVLPSECYENCPLSVLEAFTLGRAVVGSRVGGIPELVEDGITGMLFRPADPEDLAAKIDYLFRRPEEAEEMGVQARRFAEKGFDPGRHVHKITQIYEMLISDGVKPRDPAAALTSTDKRMPAASTASHARED